MSISATSMILFQTFTISRFQPVGEIPKTAKSCAPLNEFALMFFLTGLSVCPISWTVELGLKTSPGAPFSLRRQKKRETKQITHQLLQNVWESVTKVPDQSNVSRPLLPNCNAVLASQLGYCFLNCKIQIFQSVLFRLKVSYTKKVKTIGDLKKRKHSLSWLFAYSKSFPVDQQSQTFLRKKSNRKVN